MMTAHVPREWDEVLGRVHQCLEEALHEADSRSRDFEDCQGLPETAGALRQALGEAPFAGLRARLGVVERGMAEMEAELRTTEETLRGLVERTTAARHGLAAWTGRAIR